MSYDLVQTKKPAVDIESRRSILGDPEFPFWTNSPSHGMVALVNGVAHVVSLVQWTASGVARVFLRKLAEDGTDALDAEVTQTYIGGDTKLKIIDRMYYWGENQPFHIDMIDYSSLMDGVPKKLDHSDKLPPEHPLRNFPFWGSPGGKNLTIVAALDWALTHLTFVNDELPCEENRLSIAGLKRIIRLQRLRQNERRNQGVLGTKTPHKSDDNIIAHC